MPTLPALYFEQIHTSRPTRPRDGITPGALDDLADELVSAGVRSPAATALLAGTVIESIDAPHVLLCLGHASRESLGHWFRLSRSTYASVVCLSADELGRPDRVGRDDLPVITGHGAIIASRGRSGEPLAGMSVHALRGELEDSRSELSEAAGYEVRLLAPTPTAFGTAVDGLVLEEARRAGYRRVLHPGGGVLDLDQDPIADQPKGCARLPYRAVHTDDAPESLTRWITGERFTRPAARLKQLVRAPRRILDRFQDE